MSALGTTAAGKTSRIGASLSTPDPARFGTVASTTPDPARFGAPVTARAAQDASMGALATARADGSVPRANPDPARFGPAPVSSPNYGVGFAAKARAAEDMSMARQDAWDGLLGTIRGAEAQKAVNPATGVVDPYNGLVNGGPKKHADLTNMTISQVQDYQQGMLRAGYPSTAVGAYQMVSDTLGEVTKMAGYDPKTTKFTKSVQDQLARTLADDKRAAPLARSRTGLTPESYAQSLAKEWAGFATKNGKSYYAGDGKNGATTSYSDVLGAASGLVNSGAVGPDRLAGTSAVPGSTRAPGAVNPSSGTPTTPASTSVPKPTPRPSTERFASKYLGNVPTPTARPAEAPKPGRSLPDRVLAGAIDVGVGMIPGVGTAAGIYGLAAPMLGLPSVGDMALNMRDTNQFDLNTSLRNQRPSGGSSDREFTTVKNPVGAARTLMAAKAPTETASFEEKYLGYRDPTVRQTPEQKWGGMGTPTAGYSL